MPETTTMFTAHCNACPWQATEDTELRAAQSLAWHTGGFHSDPCRGDGTICGTVRPILPRLSGWTEADDRQFQAMFR